MRALFVVVPVVLVTFSSSSASAVCMEDVAGACGAAVEGLYGLRKGGVVGGTAGALHGWEDGKYIYRQLSGTKPDPAPSPVYKPAPQSDYSRNEGGVGYCSDDSNCDLKIRR